MLASLPSQFPPHPLRVPADAGHGPNGGIPLISLAHRCIHVAVTLTLAIVPLAMSVPPVRAELPPLVPRDLFFGNPVKAGPQISPDGKLLGYLAPSKEGTLNVWVRTLGRDDDRMVTNDIKRGIGFSLEMEHSDSLTLIQASAATQTDAVGTAAIEQPAARSAPALLSSVSAADAAAPDPPQLDVAGVHDAMRKSAEDSGIDLAKSGRLLVKTLQQLLQRITEEPGNEPARPALEGVSTRLPGHLHRAND